MPDYEFLAVDHHDRIPAALPEDGIPKSSEAPPVVPAAKDKVRN
jgi:hypothetical protein